MLVMRRYHPTVDYRSAILQWSILIYHASIVHFIGVWYIIVGVWIYSMIESGKFGMPLILPEALFREFMNSHVIVMLIWIAVLMMFSVVSGIYDFPSKLTHLIARLWRRGEDNPKPLLDQSIWHKVFDHERREQNKQYVLIRVRMKNGDEYVGSLQHYPVLPDSSSEKDITLGGNVRFRQSSAEAHTMLLFGDDGGVLLNTANVSSIEYLYHDEDASSEEVN